MTDRPIVKIDGMLSVVCFICHGTGNAPNYFGYYCPECGGDGRKEYLEDISAAELGMLVDAAIVRMGKRNANVTDCMNGRHEFCLTCKGSGIVPRYIRKQQEDLRRLGYLPWPGDSR